MDVDAESDTPPVVEPDVGPVVPRDVEPGDPVVPEQATSPDDTEKKPEPAREPAVDLVPPSWQRPTTTARVFRGVGRSVLALAAAALLTLTGYNWSVLHQLDLGIARTDVFGDSGAARGPAGPVAPPPLTSDVNILLVGMDSRTDPHGNPLPKNELALLHAGPDTGQLDTDTMILVHIPAGGQQAVAISFPRDSYVELAGGFGKHRLNSAFAYAHNAEASKLRGQGMTNSAQIEQLADTAGRKNLIATIEQLIGNTVTINRYAEINLGGFYDLSRAVGGVQVCLREPTHDDETDASFPAGVQTISGVQALDFVRQRHGLPGGDLDRIMRQQVFLGAVAHKMLSTGTLTSPSRIASLTKAIENSVTLSAGWDIATFAQQMQTLTSGAIQFHTIPTGPNVTTGGADVTQIDPNDVQHYVEHLIDATNTVTTTQSAPQSRAPHPTGASTPPTAGSPTTQTITPSTAANGPITANGLKCIN
ncbi:MAG TPA: LCP family protein [Pseudonocardiaceae bacterium]|nr:LCP family protein [Pseudonocardiaceae bacterium]